MILCVVCATNPHLVHVPLFRITAHNSPSLAMAGSQARIADTIDKFYGAADRTSEGAMAANAYKRSVDELDASISRELVSPMLGVIWQNYS